MTTVDQLMSLAPTRTDALSGAIRIFVMLQIICAVIVTPITSNAQVLGNDAEALVVLWSRAPMGLALTDMSRSTTELTFVATIGAGITGGYAYAGHPSLLVGMDQLDPGRLIPLDTAGLNLRIADGPGDTLWIGGSKNSQYSLTAGHLSDAYLAKLDRQGHIIWEREFGGRRDRMIQSLASLPVGDVVVAGKDNEKTWLARISANGQIVWERSMGIGKGASVSIAENKIVVAAFATSSESASVATNAYREDVGLWIFNDAGELLNQRNIRQGINRRSYASAGSLTVERSADGIYVFSEWLGQPLEVTKMNLLGELAWRKELPELMVQWGNNTPASCGHAVTVLANGDPLVVCGRSDEQIQLVQLKSQTGQPAPRWVQRPLPASHCDDSWSPIRFVRQKSDDVIWVFGSPQPGIKNCMWLGQTSVNAPAERP